MSESRAERIAKFKASVLDQETRAAALSERLARLRAGAESREAEILDLQDQTGGLVAAAQRELELTRDPEEEDEPESPLDALEPAERMAIFILLGFDPIFERAPELDSTLALDLAHSLERTNPLSGRTYLEDLVALYESNPDPRTLFSRFILPDGPEDTDPPRFILIDTKPEVDESTRGLTRDQAVHMLKTRGLIPLSSGRYEFIQKNSPGAIDSCRPGMNDGEGSATWIRDRSSYEEAYLGYKNPETGEVVFTRVPSDFRSESVGVRGEFRLDLVPSPLRGTKEFSVARFREEGV